MRRIILVTGGAGSGKTEYVRKHIKDGDLRYSGYDLDFCLKRIEENPEEDIWIESQTLTVRDFWGVLGLEVVHLGERNLTVSGIPDAPFIPPIPDIVSQIENDYAEENMRFELTKIAFTALMARNFDMDQTARLAVQHADALLKELGYEFKK